MACMAAGLQHRSPCCGAALPVHLDRLAHKVGGVQVHCREESGGRVEGRVSSWTGRTAARLGVQVHCRDAGKGGCRAGG